MELPKALSMPLYYIYLVWKDARGETEEIQNAVFLFFIIGKFDHVSLK
jgi:hypothetical protein